jgi:Fe-S cluster assembly protein SufD
MTTTVDIRDTRAVYAEQFERLNMDNATGAFADLVPVRKAAMARFAEVGFPTLRDEDWRYTNVQRIAETAFEPAAPDDSVGADQITPFRFAAGGEILLTFINGRFAGPLSSVTNLPGGVRVMSLAAALAEGEPAARRHLARHADYQRHPFTALNTAFMEDGAYVHVPRGTVLEQPIHLLYVSTSGAKPTVAHPRNLIVAETESQLKFAEQYVDLSGGTYFTNLVTEIVAAENAVVSHCKVVRESDSGFHISNLQVHQFRSGTVRSHTITLSGDVVRHDINVLMDGEGGHCTLRGLYMLHGEQHVDNHLRVEHAKPHCDSREWFKGVLDGKSRGVFTGRIVVHPDAQKTDAKQSNMNLLLSRDAAVDSKPQLEIFADDVKCTHGATMGQIDDEAVFYLRSRGVSEDAARGLLIFSFADESLQHVDIEPLQRQLKKLVISRLPHSDLLKGVIEP